MCQSNERGNGPVLIARALARTNAPARAVAFIISLSLCCHGTNISVFGTDTGETHGSLYQFQYQSKTC